MVGSEWPNRTPIWREGFRFCDAYVYAYLPRVEHTWTYNGDVQKLDFGVENDQLMVCFLLCIWCICTHGVFWCFLEMENSRTSKSTGVNDKVVEVWMIWEYPPVQETPTCLQFGGPQDSVIAFSWFITIQDKYRVYCGYKDNVQLIYNYNLLHISIGFIVIIAYYNML